MKLSYSFASHEDEPYHKTFTRMHAFTTEVARRAYKTTKMRTYTIQPCGVYFPLDPSYIIMPLR